jgi:hypothetical protein
MYDDWACNVWATQGECEVNPKFMGASCRKACKKCGSDGDEKRKDTSEFDTIQVISLL